MHKVIVNGSWVDITPCFYNNKVVYFIVGNQHLTIDQVINIGWYTQEEINNLQEVEEIF